jgi:hypothetical protein
MGSGVGPNGIGPATTRAVHWHLEIAEALSLKAEVLGVMGRTNEQSSVEAMAREKRLLGSQVIGSTE